VTGQAATAARRAVFLDRDGVLNYAPVEAGRPRPPREAGEVRLLPDAQGACRALKAAGAVLVVVTNQPDAARGATTVESLRAVNALVVRELPVDDVRTCLHDDVDDCDCRKPRPGLLVQAAQEWGLDLAGSVMVGDRWRDIGAGQQAGCRTVFIDRGYQERRPAAPDLVVTTLGDAVPWIIDRLHEERT
jgi:D-glycero-D-manno-heptose 1,7-bisphosphate phosphatase